MKTVVIIGGGHAAAEAVVALRAAKWDGNVIMISDEADIPYQRPPLSKGYLLGSINEEQLPIKKQALYDKLDCQLLLNRTVVSIDRAAKQIRLDDESSLDYAHLIIATGTRARCLNIAGAELPCVHYLRSLKDAKNIKQKIQAGSRLLVIGAGYIGLEIAASATKLGASVCVLETQDRVLSRVTNEDMSLFYQALHAEHGVDIKLSTGIQALVQTETGYDAELSDGSLHEFDIAIVGIGVLPNQELADQAGLQCDNGIVVNQQTQTSDENIYAIGDVSNHPNTFYGRSLRLESVPNAAEQAKTAAKNICGMVSEYHSFPWFWSDQYDCKLQTAGLSQGYDEAVLRGDMQSKSFALFYLKEGQLIALDAINSPRDFMKAKQLIPQVFSVSPEKIRDTASEWFD